MLSSDQSRGDNLTVLQTPELSCVYCAAVTDMPHAVNNTIAQAVQQKLGAFVWTTEKFVQEQIKAVGHDASHDWR